MGKLTLVLIYLAALQCSKFAERYMRLHEMFISSLVTLIKLVYMVDNLVIIRLLQQPTGSTKELCKHPRRHQLRRRPWLLELHWFWAVLPEAPTLHCSPTHSLLILRYSGPGSKSLQHLPFRKERRLQPWLWHLDLPQLTLVALIMSCLTQVRQWSSPSQAELESGTVSVETQPILTIFL